MFACTYYSQRGTAQTVNFSTEGVKRVSKLLQHFATVKAHTHFALVRSLSGNVKSPSPSRSLRSFVVKPSTYMLVTIFVYAKHYRLKHQSNK